MSDDGRRAHLLSRKNSFNVLLNFFEYLTKSRFRCSSVYKQDKNDVRTRREQVRAVLTSLTPRCAGSTYVKTLLTVSSRFLMAFAMSLTQK